jgi:hypothetical protein
VPTLRPLAAPWRIDSWEAAPVDRVWTSRSLRPVSAEKYAFRMGPLRRWARAHPGMPESQPETPVDLALLPPLF